MGKSSPFYADVMAVNDEVTGSCHPVIVKFPDGETLRFVVDCGMFQERKHTELNEELPFYSEKIEFCLVTHVHIDHVGRLPYMVKKGFQGSIYATEDTCEFLSPALYDSLKVLSNISKGKHTKCLYTGIDVYKTIGLTRACKYEKTIQVHERVKATFFQNGHLLGAALILVQISYPGYEDINLLFTGDYNNKNIFFDVKALPKWVLELPLTIVQESTYGNMESSEIQKCFKKNVKRSINDEKTVVALVFSLGRAQEILYELKKMQENGELDEQVPIYLDGKLAIKYTDLYLSSKLGIKKEMLDFLPKNLTYVCNDNRSDVLYDTNKKIILTTSGMGTYGPAQMYIPEYIFREDALIQFTGYTAEGTLGAKLKNAQFDEMVEIGGLITKKKADVEYTNEYSAHAKADEMIEFLKQFTNLKLVLINHGETSTKKIFAERVINEVNTKSVGLLGRDYFFRVNPYGLVKTVSTKFM